MGQGVGAVQGGEGGEEAVDEYGDLAGQGAAQLPADGGGGGCCLLAGGEPVEEGLGAPGGVEEGLDAGEGDLGGGAAALVIAQALAEALVELGAEVKEGEEEVGGVVLGAAGGVGAAGGFAGALQAPLRTARGQVAGGGGQRGLRRRTRWRGRSSTS